MHTLTLLCLSEFNNWLDARLVEKYAPCLCELLEKLKPLVASLQCLRDVAVEIGAMISEKQLDEACGRAVKPCIDNIIHLVDSATSSFPACPDYDTLVAFVKTARTSHELLVLNVVPLQSETLPESEHADQLSTFVKTFITTLGRIPVALESLEEALNGAAPLTKHLGQLRQRFAHPTETLLLQWQSLRQLDESVLRERFEQSRARHDRARERYERAVLEPRLQRELILQGECDGLQHSIGAMLQPFVRAAMLLKGSGKGKRGGMAIEGLELSSEEASLVNRNMQLLLRHLSPSPTPDEAPEHLASPPAAPSELLQELQTNLEDCLHCLHLLSEGMQSEAVVRQTNRKMAAECAAFAHTSLRGAIKTWSSTQTALQSLQSAEQFGTCVEAFRAAERELDNAQTEFDQLVDECRTALGIYHRTMHDFQLLRLAAAQCCVEEFGLHVELTLPKES